MTIHCTCNDCGREWDDDDLEPEVCIYCGKDNVDWWEIDEDEKSEDAR